VGVQRVDLEQLPVAVHQSVHETVGKDRGRGEAVPTVPRIGGEDVRHCLHAAVLLATVDADGGVLREEVRHYCELVVETLTKRPEAEAEPVREGLLHQATLSEEAAAGWCLAAAAAVKALLQAAAAPELREREVKHWIELPNVVTLDAVWGLH